MTTDDALLAELGSAFRTIDPVPSAILEIAHAALAWRDPEAALAQLIADSLTAATQVRAARAPGPRLLTFEADGLTVEVEVAEDGDSRRLLGQLVPPSRAEVVVLWADGEARAQADDIGRFSVRNIPAGPMRLSCVRTTGRVVTSWVTI